MSQNATIVFYSNEGNHPEAFHINNINSSKLQKEFDKHDIYSIKSITLENNPGLNIDRAFNTLYLESDIHDFLNKWQIKF